MPCMQRLLVLPTAAVGHEDRANIEFEGLIPRGMSNPMHYSLTTWYWCVQQMLHALH